MALESYLALALKLTSLSRSVSLFDPSIVRVLEPNNISAKAKLEILEDFPTFGLDPVRFRAKLLSLAILAA
jgi:hypothetical protein